MLGGDKMEDRTIIMPVIALRGLAVLPQMIVHFDISRSRSKAALERVMVSDQQVFLVAQRQSDVADPSIEDLYHVGCVAKIKQLVKLPDGVVRVMVEGIKKAVLLGFDSVEPALTGEIEIIQEDMGNVSPAAEEAMLRIVKEKLEEFGRESPQIAKELLPGLMLIEDLGDLLDQTAIQMPWDYTQRQEVLESLDLEERYERVIRNLISELDILRIKKQFQEKVRGAVSKNQKEYILREQLRIIREELGEDNPLSDSEEYEKKLKALKADKEVKEKITKEIGRLKSMPGSSQEGNVIRTYIETLLELPWKKASKDNNDIRHAEKILNEDHYGLEKVKERILEHLAVRALTDKGISPILCLVGPPGTGKTSIARSMARALNKKYVRISLGGVRDEAEIRGHRRTYVGAMPGRLVDGLRQAGVSNPLMLLDEIDKVSSDYKGDTSSALLEVLDGEQNVKFRDHYVELPIDLSEVLFIATANSLQDIQRPLLDRMEIIEVSSYTENEKAHIAREHLIAKQMEKNGLKEGQLSISDHALERLIRGYTREAGVRNLERKLGEICRKAARELYRDEFPQKKGSKKSSEKPSKKSVKVTENNLEKLLGKEKYNYDLINESDEVGIVRGLAWTSVGGDTLQIEVNIMPGKGEFQLTGQLGDVMKESAQAGISYIRSVSEQYQIDKEFFKEYDIHIHIPEGAVPKDGPSAGITMATAMLSAITKRKVRKDVAMTGEITLRGRVLPIGGLKEKILAAKNAGIKTICIPKKNEPDVAEIAQEIKRGLELVFVENMGQVLETALVK